MPTAPRRASVALLMMVVVLFAVVEVGTRTVVHGMSNLLNRMRRESETAARLHRDAVEPDPMLVIGNSLMVKGVDAPRLDSLLRPTRSVYRLAVENTAYPDWYYASRRLLTGGARPDVLLLCFEVRHLLGTTVRDEIFAHYLMQLRDLLHVSQSLDLTPTQTSELFFANISDFWGLRKEIRKNLLGRLMPALPSLTALMTRGTPAPPADTAQLLTTGVDRLRALKSIGDQHGVRFILALTPPLRAHEQRLMMRVGEAAGVTVIAPLTQDAMTSRDFESDGYHLSVEGRARYTAALADGLLEALGNGRGSYKP